MLFVKHRVNGVLTTVSIFMSGAPPNAVLANSRRHILHFTVFMDALIDGTVRKLAVAGLVWQTSAKVLSNG